MAETGSKSAEPKGPLRVAVLAAQQELGPEFLQSVSPLTTVDAREVTIDTPPTHLFLVGSDPASALSKADAVLLLIRFMDVTTMDALRQALKALPKEPPLAMAALLVREPEEIDFKMSCPACGQKLWVRDVDEGKRGRCPNCKTAFHLPSQPHHTKKELNLHAEVPITRVISGDRRSCTNALDNLRGHLAGGPGKAPFDAEMLIRRTAEIPIPESAKAPGKSAG